MDEPGNVVFFVYFDTREHAEHGRALLDADGFTVMETQPPYDPKDDAAWTVDAERILPPDGVDAALARVREIAAASGGEVTAVSMPWPDHPAGFDSRRQR